ncbi:MAG: stage V sporulation protein AD [Oscillospiraceae bacterium]|jgi:stage V sporulation protein AD|nr:stage V sporulation protein AD [Oscillospiraceae bacterium]
MGNYLGKGTIELNNAPSILSWASAAGPKEGDGPLANYFDYIGEAAHFGESSSWEKAEVILQKSAFRAALEKGQLAETDISFVFAGDLLNQCTCSSYGIRDFDIPFIGLFGACSTMAEGLALASVFVESGVAQNAAAMTSSHFCSAERQFRLPVNYGGQRTPTAQWTATAAGCAVVAPRKAPPYINAVTFGKVTDMGVKDVNNMGGAMASAAWETISAHLANTNQSICSFDMILTGDLGTAGSGLLIDLFKRDDIDIANVHADCGMMLYKMKEQDVHAGASGCGCSASVLCSVILNRITEGMLKNVLFVATGALMSPTMIQQGESIPSVAHAVHISCE